MEYKKAGARYIVSVEKGEEIIETLTQFCKEQNIEGASIMGVGATDHFEIAYYDTNDEEYYSKEFKGDHEIAPMMGNVSLKDGEPFVHIHINLAGDDHNAKAGHLNKAVVSAACEVFIDPAGKIERSYDEETDLDLWNL